MRYTFKKEERLCSKKEISQLFQYGSSFTKYPLKFIYLQTSEKKEFPVQILITASKKKLPKAVHRNQVKRRIREAYRFAKPELLTLMEEKGKNLLLAIVYLSPEIENYQTVAGRIEKGIQKLKVIFDSQEK